MAGVEWTAKVGFSGANPGPETVKCRAHERKGRVAFIFIFIKQITKKAPTATVAIGALRCLFS